MSMPAGMAAAMGQQKDEAATPVVPVEPAQALAPLQVDRSELANGAVLVSQTNPDSQLMAIHLAVRGRALIDQKYGQAGAVDLVHRLLDEGYSGCDHTCVARRLRRLGAGTAVLAGDSPLLRTGDCLRALERAGCAVLLVRQP